MLSGGWTHHRKIPANHLIEPNPARKRVHQAPIAVDRQRFSNHVAPKRVPKIDRDEVSDLATKDHVHGMAGILGADVDTGTLEDQPQDAELALVGGHARELEPRDDAPVRQRIPY